MSVLVSPAPVDGASLTKAPGADREDSDHVATSLWSSILAEGTRQRSGPGVTKTVLVLGEASVSSGLAHSLAMQNQSGIGATSQLINVSSAGAASSGTLSLEETDATTGSVSAFGLDYAYLQWNTTRPADAGIEGNNGKSATGTTMAADGNRKIGAPQPMTAKAECWVLADETRKDLLLSQLKRRPGLRAQDTCALLCLNLETPWAIVDELRALAALLEEIMQGADFADLDEAHRKTAKYLTSAYDKYHGGASTNKAAARTEDPEKLDTTHAALLTLSRNMGIPVVIVLCRAELSSTLTSGLLGENKGCVGVMDAVPLHLRRELLPMAGALIYHQTGKKKSNQILLDYLSHRLFQARFDTMPDSSSADEVVVPAGYDDPTRLQKDAEDTVVAGFSAAFSQLVTRKKILAAGWAFGSGEQDQYLPGQKGGDRQSRQSLKDGAEKGDEGSGEILVKADSVNMFLARAMRDLMQQKEQQAVAPSSSTTIIGGDNSNTIVGGRTTDGQQTGSTTRASSSAAARSSSNNGRGSSSFSAQGAAPVEQVGTSSTSSSRPPLNFNIPPQRESASTRPNASGAGGRATSRERAEFFMNLAGGSGTASAPGTSTATSSAIPQASGSATAMPPSSSSSAGGGPGSSSLNAFLDTGSSSRPRTEPPRSSGGEQTNNSRRDVVSTSGSGTGQPPRASVRNSSNTAARGPSPAARGGSAVRSGSREGETVREKLDRLKAAKAKRQSVKNPS
ncbi:unnamed protein product [Amoebophrya sp. A25]|nr:unnamed protein product [Amoebophrya sp. A25]|eukprot:GSA25T00015705001.1